MIKPTPEEEAAVAEATKNKLSALIGNKVMAARPTQVGAGKKVRDLFMREDGPW